jgi:tetratricopeptide (TPR) repeat protein
MESTSIDVAAEENLPTEVKSDANDYRRFDKIADDSDDDNTSDESKPLPLPEAISQAMIMKDKGNASIKENDLAAARDYYEHGLKLLKPHEATFDASHETATLLLSLHGNLAMVCLKVKDNNGAITHASKVLEKDASNVKSIFRRACAYHVECKFDEAKIDLQRLLEIDPENIAAKKELLAVNRSMKERNAKGKIYMKVDHSLGFAKSLFL